MDDIAPALVLIVEDDVQTLRLISALLRENGYETAAATNVAAALEYMETREPDLVLMDVVMPGMTGVELCATMQEDERLSRTPVIFLTALTGPQDVLRGFKAGGVDYVGKPYVPEELLARIQVHVELRRARREIRQLRGIIPLCAKCKKIRNVEGMWQEIEQYLEAHTDALFSHSLCQACADELYGGQHWYEKKKGRKK